VIFVNFSSDLVRLFDCSGITVQNVTWSQITIVHVIRRSFNTLIFNRENEQLGVLTCKLLRFWIGILTKATSHHYSSAFQIAELFARHLLGDMKDMMHSFLTTQQRQVNEIHIRTACSCINLAFCFFLLHAVYPRL
jgi:hypothetical protein